MIVFCSSYDKENMTQVGQRIGLQCYDHLLAIPKGGLPYSLSMVRIDRAYRGPVLVCSFLPEQWFSGKPSLLVQSNPGCQYFQLPAIVSEIQSFIKASKDLTDREFDLSCRKVGAQRVYLRSGKLRHDLENKFGPTLTHLRQIQKLSHFSTPVRSTIDEQVQRVRSLWTADKIEETFNEVKELYQEAHSLVPPNSLLENIGIALRRFLTGDSSSSDQEIFAASNELLSGISKLLAQISEIKHLAAEVINHAG